MPTWFDLPSEVKQIIYGFVCEADAVIYVPRDRRKTIDVNYHNAHHFHDLLLVSKKFITTNEFACAVLRKANLTLERYTELRRCAAELNKAVKSGVRHMHLRVGWKYTVSSRLESHGYNPDSFASFSNLEKILSNEFAFLRKVHVSIPEYCSEIAYHTPFTHQGPTTDEFNEYVGFICGRKPYAKDGEFQVRTKRLNNIAAAFIGDRNSFTENYRWRRVNPWLRRLILYAEQNDIEVLLHITLCVSNHTMKTYYVGAGPEPLAFNGAGQQVARLCYSNARRHRRPFEPPHLQLHLPATMSTKDYILHVTHNDVAYSYYQGLAYAMIHAEGRTTSLATWGSLLDTFDLEPADVAF